MKRLDKYIVWAVLLLWGGICLYLWQDTYTGMFWGVFFAYIKDILWINKEESIEVKPETLELQKSINVSK